MLPIKDIESSTDESFLSHVATCCRFGCSAHSREHQRLGSLLASERLLAEKAEEDDKTVPFSSWNNVPDTLNHLLTLVLRLLSEHPLGLFCPSSSIYR